MRAQRGLYFEDFSVGEGYWSTEPPTYEQLTEAAVAWFGRLDLSSPATIATYRSAITKYASAAGFEIRLSTLIEVPERHRGNTREVSSLTDSQLNSIRKEANESPPIRSALELAIAGLTIEQLAMTRAADLSASPGHAVGKVTLVDGREIELFDQVGVKWLMGEGTGTLPIGSDEVTDEAIRKRLSRLVYRATHQHGGLRELRVTGVRRAIAIGISRRRIAESLDLSLPDRWGDFRRNASRRPEAGYDPIPADAARGRKIGEMTEAEFDKLLDGLGETA